MVKKKKTGKDKEKVVEVFEVKKPGEKEKEIVKEGFVEERHEKKNQSEKHRKQFNIILWTLGVLILITFFLIYSSGHSGKINYKGVEFEKTIEGNLTLYQTSVPVIYNGNNVDYNFYLRTNPNDLEKIEFTGEINFLENAVMNATEFDCNGDQVIAIANLLKQYEILGTKVIKDENASCDSENRYLYISIIQGDETKLVQDSETCYTVYVKDCEILPATEKLMAENFATLNEKLNG